MTGHSEIQGISGSTVIVINNDGMGCAEEPLRHKLLGIYLGMLRANESYPGAICFYAAGVKMAVEDSPVLEELRELEAKGVRLIVCRTCLQYYGLTEKAAAGAIGGMNDIVQAQRTASKVITL